VIGFITFRLAERELACRLDDVREVVRLSVLEVLPGMAPPISGLLELRGNPLPVVDLRAVDPRDGTRPGGARGDVLVLDDGVQSVGVVVDQVTAVHNEAELVSTGEEPPSGLPDYVVEVLRRPVNGTPVLMVDLRRLLGVAA
jgi:purine-binding chemotaxis protein CheW